MKRDLFLKLKGQTNSKNKSEFLNVTFLDTFCICLWKNGENGACALIHPILHTLIELMQKINKKFSFRRLWGDIHPCNTTYQSWYTTFLFDHFSEDWNLLVFLPYIEPRKEVCFVKIGGYWKFGLRVSYRVWFCWQIRNHCALWLA